jgi:hypothetical protein
MAFGQDYASHLSKSCSRRRAIAFVVVFFLYYSIIGLSRSAKSLREAPTVSASDVGRRARRSTSERAWGSCAVGSLGGADMIEVTAGTRSLLLHVRPHTRCKTDSDRRFS